MGVITGTSAYNFGCNYCYKSYSAAEASSMTWAEAKNFCEQNASAELVSIVSNDESAFLLQLVSSIQPVALN